MDENEQANDATVAPAAEPTDMPTEMPTEMPAMPEAPAMDAAAEDAVA